MWVNVNDRLPEDGKNVAVVFERSDDYLAMNIGHYVDGKWYLLSHRKLTASAIHPRKIVKEEFPINSVLFWYPLPELFNINKSP